MERNIERGREGERDGERGRETEEVRDWEGGRRVRARSQEKSRSKAALAAHTHTPSERVVPPLHSQGETRPPFPLASLATRIKPSALFATWTSLGSRVQDKAVCLVSYLDWSIVSLPNRELVSRYG